MHMRPINNSVYWAPKSHFGLGAQPTMYYVFEWNLTTLQWTASKGWMSQADACTSIGSSLLQTGVRWLAVFDSNLALVGGRVLTPQEAAAMICASFFPTWPASFPTL